MMISFSDEEISLGLSLPSHGASEALAGQEPHVMGKPNT